MGINRSGYYKWKSRQGKLNRYEQNRIVLSRLLQEEHVFAGISFADRNVYFAEK